MCDITKSIPYVICTRYLARPRIANFGIFLDVLSFCVFGDFFRLSKKSDFGVFFVQQNIVETTLPDGLETSGERAYR